MDVEILYINKKSKLKQLVKTIHNMNNHKTSGTIRGKGNDVPALSLSVYIYIYSFDR